jgi:hypothetical protein
MRISHRLVLLLALWLAVSAGAAEGPDDVWSPIRRLAGSWTGTSTGQPGDATVSRRYSWVLRDRYLNEVSTSIYPPQDKNRKGERHEHWSMFSYDKARKAIVLRQFHVEGFVNTYRLTSIAVDKIVFESESFENLSNSWKARETYEFVGADEFVETFELAAPGKEFEVYSRTRLVRSPP